MANSESDANAHAGLSGYTGRMLNHKSYLDADYRIGDFIVFGSETEGLRADFLAVHRNAYPYQKLRNSRKV